MTTVRSPANNTTAWNALSPRRIELSADEARRLAAILDRRFDPPPALREALARLADPERSAPALHWPDA